MPTERNSDRSTSTSPNLNNSSNHQNTLNIRQRVFPTTSTYSNYPLGISFLSTSTPINESEDMAYIEKRTAHNALERQRREGLNTKFQELAHVLPALQQIRRPSKSMIVAKSLEFVSNAEERESDFQGQLRALRVENAQLLRQARLANKRIRRQVDTDTFSAAGSSPTISKKAGKQSTSCSTPNVDNSPSPISQTATFIKSTPLVKSRQSPSRMKPQLRLSSVSVSNTTHSPTTTSNADEKSPSVDYDKHSPNTNFTRDIALAPQMKRSRSNSQTSDEVYRFKESCSTPTPPIESSTLKSPPVQSNHSNKRGRHNYTAGDPNSMNSNDVPVTINTIDYQSLLHQQHKQMNINIPHHRYSSHQPSSTVDLFDDIDSIITTPIVSRHSSISDQQLPMVLPFNTNPSNEMLPASESVMVVPSQFDITPNTTPTFGNEHSYPNNYNDFGHVVTAIPAMRTPLGRNQHHQQPQTHPYDPTLAIFNSLMQDQNSNPNNSNYYWP